MLYSQDQALELIHAAAHTVAVAAQVDSSRFEEATAIASAFQASADLSRTEPFAGTAVVAALQNEDAVTLDAGFESYSTDYVALTSRIRTALDMVQGVESQADADVFARYLVELAKRTLNASGGLFGIGSDTSVKEAAWLAQFSNDLGVGLDT